MQLCLNPQIMSSLQVNLSIMIDILRILIIN